MRSGLDDYQLRLSSDAIRALSRNGTQVEALSWELEPTNGQVFVQRCHY
jgi:hypothetical protein